MATHDDGAVGFYEAKQEKSPSLTVRWSHGRRMEVACELATRLGGRTLLDYGCGDGTFLRKVHPGFVECVGTDMNGDGFAYLTSLPNTKGVLTRDLDPSFDGRWDLVFCMEVLEHCVPSAIDEILRDLKRLVAPGGAVIISVPIETGPTALAKYAIRRLLGLRKVGDYAWTEKYELGTLLKLVLADENTSVPRPLYPDDGPGCHSHYGFNWRALRKRLERDLVVEESLFSPLAWTRGLASSQAWFVCRVRRA